ncbi:MAG TPA: hypothetical protein VGN35_04430 [Jatrophihabitantaceae bacterium]|jgi:hypothetical protein|nr:hypothetical protein [Jatrophihabitantaceae bacterium]
MTVVTVLPPTSEVLFDTRDDGRWLRITWHPADDAFVLSIWRDRTCAATFQLARSASPELINTLTRSLAEGPGYGWSPSTYARPRARWSWRRLLGG